MTALKDKQEAFCREYLIDLNATQAAIRAGYSEKTATVIGSENLAKPNIQARLQELMSERNRRTESEADYVLRRLKEIDSLDIIDILNDELTAFKPLSEWPKSWRISISGIDIQTIVMSDGSEEPMERLVKKIKWPDKTKNLELIGKHVDVKAWDKEQVATENDKPITINFVPAVKPDAD